MTPLYFDKYRDRILKEFTFRPFDTKENLELEPLLKQDNSVTVHIRRGDYVGSSSLEVYAHLIIIVMQYVRPIT